MFGAGAIPNPEVVGHVLLGMFVFVLTYLLTAIDRLAESLSRFREYARPLWT